MAEGMPQSELVKRAFTWMADQLQAAGTLSASTASRHPGKTGAAAGMVSTAQLQKLMDEAGMRFNLSPCECDSLLHLFTAPADGRNIG